MNDDRKLIAEIISGNQAAFKVFIEKYQKLVSHVVFSLVKNKTDREDLCQDIFIKTYNNLSAFKYACKLSTWVARIAHNTCLNYLAKKKLLLLNDMAGDEPGDWLDQVPGYEISPADSAIGKDLAQRVREEIDKLPPLFGVLIALYHLEDMSYEEIASVTGFPMGTVKSYLYRARKRLRENLLDKYELEEIWQ